MRIVASWYFLVQNCEVEAPSPGGRRVPPFSTTRYPHTLYLFLRGMKKSTAHVIDKAEWEAIKRRMSERRWLLAVTCIILLGLLLTFRAKTHSFAEQRLLLDERAIVNLSALEGSRDLLSVFALIYPDPKDQKIVSSHLYRLIVKERAGRPMPWALRNIGQLNTYAFSIPARLAENGGEKLRERLAQSRQRLGMNPDGSPRKDSLATVKLASQGANQVRGCVFGEDNQPLNDIHVTMRGSHVGQTTTNASGCFWFDGMAAGDTVSIRPVKRYYSFASKVVTDVGQGQVLHFVATEHRIGLVGSASQLQRIKPKLAVRSPQGFSFLFWGLSVIYLISIYSLHFYWFRKRFSCDPVLLPIVHILTGVALMLMFSLQDPLRDIMRAEGFVIGVVAGCLLLGIVSQIDFQQPYWRKRPQLWLGLGILLAAGLYVFGSGPTGSDAKVNLFLPVVGAVQPVELIKLALAFFLAGYFARNWTFLRELKQREGLPQLLQKLNMPRYRDLIPVTFGICIGLVTFFLLKDMGPALVIGCTFLALYGIVRDRWLAVGLGMLALVLCFWVAYHTAAVPMVAGRIEMLISPWENFVNGGEHLAHAYWAMASGGATGQGLGSGHPNYIPAAHTDMVLPALGEELGFIGLFIILSLYAVLVYRALHISLQAGGIFSMFLGLSITLITLFQIILIAGGAFGLIPLSGVVTPFLSYGKSSMVINCVLIGILLSISANSEKAGNGGIQQRQFQRPVWFLSGATLLLLAIIAIKAFYVQTVLANDWSIKPALMLRGSGERAYTYNPRILDARNQLTRGTIYDRNGIPLASSQWDEVEQFRDVFADLEVDVDSVDRTASRFYPFQALTFYLLGDIGTRVKWGASNSLYAEHAYLSHLRGYNNYPEPVEKQKVAFGEAEPIVRYDYAELLPLVRFGEGHLQADALVARNRHLKLTIDVRLQQRVAKAMEELVPEGKTASAVVLDAAMGDVLASVTYPLPTHAFLDPTSAHLDPLVFDRGFGEGAKPPGSTFKLVTAMAALNKDPGAMTWLHVVRASDRYARRGEPTGKVNMARGIRASSNVFFAALSHDVVGVDSMLQALDLFEFGFGSGALEKRERLDLLRAPDNLRQVGFGQGPLTASPLQVALVSATIANNGLRPHVRWVDGPNEPWRPGEYVTLPQHAQTIASYMREVVMHYEGTAKTLRDITVPMAGKTGTAEEKKYMERDGKRVQITYNHAWFTGFAPYVHPDSLDQEPKIAVAVLVEEGGGGGRIAAPIAGAIVEEAADLGLIARD